MIMKKQQLSKRIRNMLKQGKTVYYVYAFPEQQIAFIETSVIMGAPYWVEWDLVNGGAWFVPCHFYPDCLNGEFWSDTFSLQDGNIIPNDYNHHKVFTSRRKAQSYVKSIRASYKPF